ncbi:MAG: CRTAC1 family protein [Acidimicrobiia bacterium]
MDTIAQQPAVSQVTPPPVDRRRRGLWLMTGILTGVLLTGGAAWAAVALLGPGAPVAAMKAPRFVEETTAAGVDHTYDGEFGFFVGGGLAVFDCDGDGRQDLYLAGGVNAASLYKNVSPAGAALRFTELADPVTDLIAVTGAYPLDVDGDAHIDLAVLRQGENVLLRNVGNCRFERANETWEVDGGEAWTVAFSAKWEGTAALPTLAFGNYLDLDESGRQTGACSDHALFRPAGPSRYDPALALSPGWCTLSILFSDWDRSGGADLRMTNDRHYYRDGEEQLWRFEPGLAPRLYTSEEGWRTMQIWGMGIASQDLTGDGRPEVFLTSQGDNKLQTLEQGPGGPAYRDIAFARGATAHRPFLGDTVQPSTAWHAEFQDVNNDTYMDLFVTKGNVESMPEYAAEDPNNLLLNRGDGTFVEGAVDAGIIDFARSRGAALADLNVDGMLDLVVVERRETVKVWRNVGWGVASTPKPMGHWIALRLEQGGSNRDAVGAWIEVGVGERTIHREVTVGGGHAGGQIGWIHLGLGTAEKAEVRVQWPDGETGPWQSVEGDQFVTIERGVADVRTWLPPEK